MNMPILLLKAKDYGKLIPEKKVRADGREVVTATAWLPLRDRGGTPT